MKKLLTLALIIGFSVITNAQDEKSKKLPAVDVKTMEGKSINTSELSNDGKPMIIDFWATWCKPCIKELNNIADVYDDWVEETGVKIYAVSIDDTKSSARVPTLVNTLGWEYDIILDQNKDFFRKMNGNAPPLVILLDGKGNIVYTHNGYNEGDEDELYEHLLELTEEKSE